MTPKRRSPKRLVPRLRRGFVQDKAGAIAPMFGLLLVPILTMSVFATDYSRALGSRVALQDAVDAAGLALAHLPSSTTQTQLDAAARSWIAVNLKDKSIGPLTVVARIDNANRTVSLSANANVATLSGGLTSVLSGGGPGILQLPVSAAAKVKWGTKIELALVLDNTYSMTMNGSTKMADLKTAATNLVNTLSAAAPNPGDLKVGVVPFSISVNVGSSYQTASWITGSQPTTGYGPDLFTVAGANRFSLFSAMGVPWSGCVESRPPPYDVQDDAPTSGTPGTMFVPFFSPDEEDTETWNYYGNTIQYLNRYKPNDPPPGANKDYERFTNPAKYKGSTSTSTDSAITYLVGPGYKMGPNMGCGTLTPLLRMTPDMNTVKTRLDAMTGTGETHIPIGLAWGWHLLSPNAPFSDGAPYKDVKDLKVTKVAVLVTDGANTYFTTANGLPFNGTRYKSSYTGYGYADQNRIGWGTNPTDAQATTTMNARLTQLCKNMNDAGIKIYTVPVQVTDANIKGLLKGCASEPNNYIEVTTPAGMQTAFASIAGSITKLRISH